MCTLILDIQSQDIVFMTKILKTAYIPSGSKVTCIQSQSNDNLCYCLYISTIYKLCHNMMSLVNSYAPNFEEVEGQYCFWVVCWFVCSFSYHIFFLSARYLNIGTPQVMIHKI